MAGSAKTFTEQLTANVDDWYDGRTDFGTFKVRQKATWDAIEGAGPRIKEAVLKDLRAQLPRL